MVGGAPLPSPSCKHLLHFYMLTFLSRPFQCLPYRLVYKEVYREEKPLRHISMGAKFLDNNKPKIQFHLICQMSARMSERTVFKFRKRERKCLCCVYLLHKARAITRKFHVTVVQRRLRNVQKSAMHL